MSDLANPGPLACPSCGADYPADERFCSSCGLPLTYSGEVDVEQSGSELQQQARKIKPQYARGELRQVVTARQLPEAQLIQMLLLDEGIPSVLRRTTWDVPEMMPAGPRAVLVPESGYSRALATLNKSEQEVIVEQQMAREAMPSPVAVLFTIFAGLGVVALVLLLAKA